MCFAYEITCLDLFKNICIEHIINLILKNFKYFDCLVCKKKENYKHFYFDCKYNKKYWQEVKKMTTNLYIGDHVFNLETLVFGYHVTLQEF
jgi:hypothetical protein